MTKEKYEKIITIIIFIVSLIIMIAAIVPEDGSMDEQVGWECEK